MIKDIFCNKDNFNDNIIYEDETSYILMDEFPASIGHILVISKKHYDTLLSIPLDEYHLLMFTVRKSVEILKEVIGDTDFNIVYCEGATAGQGIKHIHWHIVPRDKDDGITIDLNESLEKDEYKCIKQEFRDLLKRKESM